jgi:Na+/H+-dicarboxylate symporter
LVVTIKPGNKETKDGVGEGTAKSTTTTQDAIMDLIRNIFPENLFQAAIQQGQTYYTYEDQTIIKSHRNITDEFASRP